MRLVPLAAWGFVTHFLYNVAQGQNFSPGLMKYIVRVIVANTAWAVVVLPLLVRAHGVGVVSTLMGAAPALITAFFSRPSAATLPITMGCMEKNLTVPNCYPLPYLCASA
ncbi:MAG: cation:dicarboxylate symporter family transporter [Anaplasma sp.]